MSDPRSTRFVRSHLKIKHLALLIELGRHESILHAANAAKLTQPAASKLLKDLEYTLGIPLFERLPRGVVPTAYGEILIQKAGAALAEMDAAHQEVMEVLAGLHGTVSVGSVMTPSISLLPDAIQLLKAQHANVHVSVTVDTSKVLVERLLAGDLDLMLGRILDTHAARDLDFEPIDDEHHQLVVQVNHPLIAKRKIKLSELVQESWILPQEGSILRDRLTALFLSQGLEPPWKIVEATALPVITKLVLASDMIAPLPIQVVRSYVETGLLTIIPFELGLRMDHYGIVKRKNHQLSPSAEAMLLAIRKVVASQQARY